ncbi:SUKH-3 domain-containing protein [Hymenobacter terricola]|uniref:SUKH-3 domain-containing protein n=1 Tax=Hymenobacter terricola TaxID=2819236 RepID=UPI001B3015FF|nr:SUKH-3 domain-containing protein [Hymenobacter terricola]
MPFSASTHSYLSQAGWFAGRRVSTIKYRAYLAGEGYAWFPKVAAFLEEFGDLRVQFERESRRVDTLNLDACDASADFDGKWVQQAYAPRIGQTQLCVIGQAYSDHLLLFMDEEGNVYGGFDDFLCFIADSGHNALEAICTNQPAREIS